METSYIGTQPSTGGVVVQEKQFASGAFIIAGSAGAIPIDNTIPQITEGTEILTGTYTPTDANNKLVFEFSGAGSVPTAAAYAAAAVFRSDDTNAIGAKYVRPSSGNEKENITIVGETLAGTTSPITFSVRASVNSGTWRFNGEVAAHFGGAEKVVLRIREVSPNRITPTGAIVGGGGATGGGTDKIFVENGQTVTTDYTLTANNNAHSVGPITVNTGITVTIPTGANWVVS